MSSRSNDLRHALDEVSASSAGGAPFLIAFGFTLMASAVVSYFVPLKTAAIVVMFQGNVALPIAFWLERRMARGTMARDNPLRSLSIMLAMSQLLGLPAVFIAYSYHPAMVPAALAAIGAAHFVPYAWLHRTRLYIVLGVAVAVGSLAITMLLRREAFPWVLFYLGVVYWSIAPFLVVHARRVTETATATATA